MGQKLDKNGVAVRDSPTSSTIGDPLCTLLVTFGDMDNPGKQITTSHVFTSKNPKNYPQTRRVVYTSRKGGGTDTMSTLSPASPRYIDDSDSGIEPSRPSRASSATKQLVEKVSQRNPDGSYQKTLVQEVTLAFESTRVSSASDPRRVPAGPITVEFSSGLDPVVSAQPAIAYSVPIHQTARSTSSYSHSRSGSFGDYLDQPESVERVGQGGRTETEFPVRIAYFGGQPVSPVSTIYRVPIVVPSSTVVHATPVRVSPATRVIQETTTSEVHTFSTRKSGEEMATSPSSVSALKQQFEQTARDQWADAQKSQSRSTSRAGSRPPSAMDGNRQIVVVNKNAGSGAGYKRKDFSELVEHERSVHIREEIEESTRVRTIERPAYTPNDERAVLSTTVVDIDPTAGSPFRGGEDVYHIEQQAFRTIKTYAHPVATYEPATVRGAVREDYIVHRVEPRPSSRTEIRTTVEKFEEIRIEEERKREEERRIAEEERKREEERQKTLELERKLMEVKLIEEQKKKEEKRERERLEEEERRRREDEERRREEERQREMRRQREERALEEERERLRRKEEELKEQERIRKLEEQRREEERIRREEEQERRRREDEERRKIEEEEEKRRREEERRRKEKEDERRRKEQEEDRKKREELERKQREEEERRRREDEERRVREEATRRETWEQITRTTKVDIEESEEMATKQRTPVKPEAKKEERKETTTTTTEFRISSPTGNGMSESADYRSTISARPAFNRTLNNFSNTSSTTTTTYGSPISGNRVLKIVNEVGSSSLSGMSPFGQHAASSIRDAREREKKEMSDLNDRLASYIEKVRFLEAQNRKLASDLDLLRGRWGKDTSSIRQMYESELREARKLIDDTNRQKDDLEKDIRRMVDELADYRRKYEDALRAREGDRERIDDLLQKLSKLEAEISLLKRRIASLEDDVTRVKKENQRLLGELQRARNDLDQETLNRIDYQNQVQTLLEEIDFIRRVQDQEIQELQALASRDTTPENREFFKNELASAIRDIRQEYDQVSNANRNDMESWYKLKVQEIHTQSTRQNMEQGYAKEEVKRLRTQLSDLRGKLADLEGRNALLEKQTQELNYQLEDDQRSYESALNDRDAQIRKMREECQALMVELQMLLDTKQTLDAEIAIYRKMLEGEENRAGLRQLVEQVVRTHGITHSDETESMRVVKGETASRTSFQRSAKGNVSIHETSPEGKFVVLENTHRSREEPIGDWKLKRKIDGKHEIVYTFPKDFVLRPGKNVKIWARGAGGTDSPPDSLVFAGETSFGTGNNVQTILYNTQGEERATLIQRVSQA